MTETAKPRDPTGTHSLCAWCFAPIHEVHDIVSDDGMHTTWRHSGEVAPHWGKHHTPTPLVAA